MADVTSLEAIAPAVVDVEPPASEELIELTVPARNDQLRLIRLTAAGVASTIGFGLERLEELRIAVDELAAVAVDEASPGQRIAVRFAAISETITITGRVPTDSTASPTLHRVAQELLDLMADDFSLSVVGGVLEFRLVKHGAPDTAQE